MVNYFKLYLYKFFNIKKRGDLATVGIAIGAALVVSISALATGIAQARIGAAGCGTIAERPEAAGTVIILLAIPETMVILGFVVGMVILFVLSIQKSIAHYQEV